MKTHKRIVIIKQDGTLERFSLPKLRSCLARVIQLGDGKTHLADPLAQAVALHLNHQSTDEMPNSEYIFYCVRSVLQQTGLPEAATALSAHRRLRQARRRHVRVYDPLRPIDSPIRWHKGAIVATLQNVYDLRQAVARFLAGRIENQVFGLGYRLLSKPFLAELVQNEVLAWGLLFDRIPQRARDNELKKPLVSGQPRQEG